MWRRIIFYVFAVILAIAVVVLANDAARLATIASEQLSLENSRTLMWKWVLERLSLSIYSGAREQRADIEAIYTLAAQRQELARRAAIVFAAVVAGFLAMQYRRAASTPHQRARILCIDLLILGLICLITGLVAPIFSLKAFTDLPVLGEVILKYESKSIISTIGALARGDSYFVALLIATFSVLVPLFKTLICLAALLRPRAAWHRQGVLFARVIGKWSMADVFVVAILIAYFAASGEDFSEAAVGLGLYFFAAYCVISIIANGLLIKSFEHDDTEPLLSANGER